MYGRIGSLEALCGSLNLFVRIRLTVVFVALSVLSLTALGFCAAAQEDTADYWVRMSEELFVNGSYDESVQAMDKALQIEPEDANLWQTKGTLLALFGRKDEALIAHQRALDLFNESIEKKPKDAEAWFLKAHALISMNRLEEAVRAYDEAIELIELCPQENADSFIAWSAWRSKADVLMRLGRYDESIEAYDRAIAQIPANDTELQAAIYSTKGISLNNLGRYRGGP